MNRLKERRLELGLTQEAVSGILKLADPRMDVSMVSRFENGVCLPTEEVTEALEAALRASRAYLFGEDEKAELPMRTAETERIACLIPKGRRNAISREDLAAALHTTDRKMRKAVAEAKKQGVPVTIISDICKGKAEIAALRFERDCAEVVYKSAMEAINSMKLQIRLLDNQLDREWGAAK